ncbi:hypothetical protein VNO78_21805 [Psophocarpus tetragonolobus]|uniref:Uncharacterized protein n=1 Tax=Psophocarpus tetragonolobus TaxID=3891 RepID=A0AAN9SCK9_PSOTE
MDYARRRTESCNEEWESNIVLLFKRMKKVWKITGKDKNDNHEEWKGKIVNVVEVENKWIEESLVGWLNDPAMF